MKQAKDPFARCASQGRGTGGADDLEEKAALCAGRNFWNTRAIERLGLPS